MDGATLSLADLGRATLARQMLLERHDVKPLDAIGRLLAIQAQWPKPPFIALFSRLAKFEREDLQALARKSAVVRGTAFRATIFTMTAKDYAAYRSTFAIGLERAVTSIVGGKLPQKDYARAIEAGRRFFAEPHTFEQLRTELGKKTKENDVVRRMSYLVRLRVPLLQVPSEVKWGWHAACDFVLAESLVGAIAEAPDREGLVLRYLAALGPASVADAQSFLGLTGLKDVFAKLRPKLAVFRGEDKKELFDLPKAPRPGGDVAAPVRFLPDFDNVVLGHADRRRFIAAEHAKRVFLPGLAITRTYLVDGRVAGAWKVETKQTTATLTVEPFVPIAKKHRAAIEEEAEAVVRFFEPDAAKHTLAFAKA